MSKQPTDMLTLEAMDGANWEPALSLPLPTKPHIDLLAKAREDVLTYLDWVTNDLVQGNDHDAVRREINRAAARLIEIAEHWPAALHDEVEANIAADEARSEAE